MIDIVIPEQSQSSKNDDRQAEQKTQNRDLTEQIKTSTLHGECDVSSLRL